jgi:queuine/archaeosine tRNA-ribosyltransferase
LFGIIQGGLDHRLRNVCVEGAIARLQLDETNKD